MSLTCRVGEPTLQGRRQNWTRDTLTKAIISSTFLYVPHPQPSAIQTMFHVADHHEAKPFAALVGASEPVYIFPVPRTTKKTTLLSAGKKMPKDAGVLRVKDSYRWRNTCVDLQNMRHERFGLGVRRDYEYS